jgi:hypothetical protein
MPANYSSSSGDGGQQQQRQQQEIMSNHVHLGLHDAVPWLVTTQQAQTLMMLAGGKNS